MPDAEPSEAAVVAVGGNPLAAGFDRQRGEVGVGNLIAARPGVGAQSREDPPVPRPGREQRCVRLGAKDLAERERL